MIAVEKSKKKLVHSESEVAEIPRQSLVTKRAFVLFDRPGPIMSRYNKGLRSSFGPAFRFMVSRSERAVAPTRIPYVCHTIITIYS